MARSAASFCCSVSFASSVALALVSSWSINSRYEQTRQAITLCRQGGFTDGDIALVSYCGREKSALLHLDALGADALTSFTGEYDAAGHPVFRDGAILAESVYRFKGQSAQAVIFAEIDFDVLDERQLCKLFVGRTRALEADSGDQRVRSRGAS